MALTASPITAEHQQFAPHSGDRALPAPWVTLATSSRVTAQRVQNTTSAPITVETGTAISPVVLQPGDTLFAWGDDSRRAITRVPYCGRRFTTVRRIFAAANAFESNPIGTPNAIGINLGEGDLLLAAGVLRGDCGGSAEGTVTVSLTNPPAGVPSVASATGVAAGGLSIGACIAGLVVTPGVTPLGVSGVSSGPCGLALENRVGRLLIVCESEPLVFGHRIRSNVSEDAGSLFQATQAVAVELGISEAFPYGEGIPSGQLRVFSEALTPDDAAQRYYALPTRNQEMLTTVEGETNLGRLASTYPSPIMQTALTIPGQVGGRVTAQQAIQFVVNQWEQEHPWLSFEPIPDLRLVMPGAVAEPRQHYLNHPTDGILTTAAVVIEQEGNNRRTMRELLDEWLSVFPGTLRQNSSGRIEIVPHVGPDAPDGPQVQLGWRDLISLSDGEDDPRGVVNRARVLSQGWEYREGQALMPPTYTLATRSDGLTPGSMDDVLPDTEPLPNGHEREFDLFLDPSTPVTLNVLFSAYTGASRTSSSPFQEAEIPASFTLGLGQTVRRTFTWTIFNVDNVQTIVDFARTQSGVRVTVSGGGRYAFGPNPFVGMRYAAYLVEILSAEGTAWVRDNTSVEAEFGLATDELPGPDGTDALAASRALHGERLATINSSVFQLTPEQAQQVARSHVLWNINPRTIRDVRQSEWDKYPVKFDHIGRHVELPNGEIALVENRSYSDSFSATHGSMMGTFSAAVTEVVLDTTTDWLYLDNGDFFELDDGTPVERS